MIARLVVSTILLSLASAGMTFAGSVAFDAINRPVEPIICKSKVHCHRMQAGLPAAYAAR